MLFFLLPHIEIIFLFTAIITLQMILPNLKLGHKNFKSACYVQTLMKYLWSNVPHVHISKRAPRRHLYETHMNK